MASTQLSPAPVLRVYDNSGELAISGSIYTYVAGTSTPLPTFTDAQGLTANTNPVVLNSRGECSLWLTPNQAYKLVAYDEDDNLLWSKDYVSTPSDTPFVSVTAFGALGLGISRPDGQAFRDAVESLGEKGGMIIAPIPPVSYCLDFEEGDDSHTAVFIPDNVSIFFEGPSAPNFIPGANNTVCFRITGKSGGLYNAYGDNRTTAFSNCSALRLAPIDEADTTIHSDIQFNKVSNFTCRGFSEPLTLRPGPKVSAQDSYLYYNTFIAIDVRNNTRGIWLKVAPNDGSGANANNFYSTRIGETGTNTGIQIDLGSENNFFGFALEGIESGTSPNTTPTGLIVATGTGASTANNSFYGLRIEGCTLDIELNGNKTTQFYGIANTGTINGTPGVYTGSQGIAYNGAPANNGARFFVGFPNNGEGVRFGNPVGTTANNFFSAVISPAGGPTGYVEFLYSGAELLTFGGVNSTYTGTLRLSNPLTGKTLVLGTQGGDKVEIDATGNLFPVSDNAYTCGASGHRWTAVWATNGTIQTSDETLKDDIKEIDEAVLRAWGKVNFCQYKWKDEKANEKARIHFGVIAQKIISAFESEGLNALDYGIVWKGEYGSYSVSYSEALALECAYLRSLIGRA